MSKKGTIPMATTPQYGRASDYIRGIGKNIDAIQGRDVLLTGYWVEERETGPGDEKVLVKMEIAELDSNGTPETDEDGAIVKTLYHIWSANFANSISELPDESLPLIVQFNRQPTSSGFRAWVIS